MQDKTVNLNLDQAAPPAIIHVTQGDTAWRWHFPVWLDGLRWSIPSGATAILKGTKPDGHVFAYTGSISSNEVVVNCALQMTICAGPVGCTLIILDTAGKRLHVARIALLVAADPEASFDVASDSSLPAYAEVLDGISELLELASTIPDDLPGYITNWLDTNVDPATGYVLDNTLTLSNAAAPADKVGDLKSAVGSNAFALDEHILQPIKYATLSSDLAVTFSSPENQLDTDYVSGLIPLPETLDGKIKHNGNGYSSSRAIVFYNNAKAPIGSETQNGYNLIETTIPDGSAFFRLRRGGGSASQVLQASFNLSAAEKANYLRTLIHFEPDLYIYDFDAPDIFTMEHTEISTSTGEDTYSSASGYSGTDFILLPEDIELIGTYAYTGSGRARVAFYNSDKVFIRAVYSNSKRLAATSIPEGAVFVRFGTHSTIPPASCIAVGLVKMSKSNDEIIDMIRQSLV